MSNVLHAEDRFLSLKNKAIAEMVREGELRELAATAVQNYYEENTHRSNSIINGIPLEDKQQFSTYLQEYIKK